MPFLEKEMAVAVGDHGTDFCVAFCTRTKFIAVVVLKIHWTSRSKDSKKLRSFVSTALRPGEKKVLQEGTSSQMPQDSHSGGLPPIAKDVTRSLHPVS